MFLGQTPEEVAGVLHETKRHAIRNGALFAFVVSVVLIVISESALVSSISFVAALGSMYVATADI